MRNSFILFLSVVSSVSARTSLRRLLANNAEMLTTVMGTNAPDMTCTASMAMDAQSCGSLSDSSGSCVWCPIGDQFGACVSSDIANTINAADVPHLTCGQDPSAEDVKFWGDVETCDVAGVTEKACLTTQSQGCTWCAVDSMGVKFGLCFSNEYKKELFDLDDTHMMNMFLRCTQDSTDTTLQVGSLTDMKCVLEGNADPDAYPKQDTGTLCDGALDSEGVPCKLVKVMDFFDFCLSETQAGLFDFLMATADSMGIEPDTLASMAAGGSLPVLGGGEEGSAMDFGDGIGDGTWDDLDFLGQGGENDSFGKANYGDEYGETSEDEGYPDMNMYVNAEQNEDDEATPAFIGEDEDSGTYAGGAMDLGMLDEEDEAEGEEEDEAWAEEAAEEAQEEESAESHEAEEFGTSWKGSSQYKGSSTSSGMYNKYNSAAFANAVAANEHEGDNNNENENNMDTAMESSAAAGSLDTTDPGTREKTLSARDSAFAAKKDFSATKKQEYFAQLLNKQEEHEEEEDEDGN